MKNPIKKSILKKINLYKIKKTTDESYLPL
jgi:hypothetical protein